MDKPEPQVPAAGTRVPPTRTLRFLLHPDDIDDPEIVRAFIRGVLGDDPDPGA